MKEILKNGVERMMIETKIYKIIKWYLWNSLEFYYIFLMQHKRNERRMKIE